jgi:hypothetical protein
LKRIKKTNKTRQNYLSFGLELWLYLTPLTWYEQENLGLKAHFVAFPKTPWLLGLLSPKDGSQRRCASYQQTGTPVHKTHNSALFASAKQQRVQTLTFKNRVSYI